MPDFTEVELYTLRTGHASPTSIPSFRSLQESLPRQIVDLQEELSRKKAQLKFCNALLSPIRRLPREILLRNFLFASDASVRIQSDRFVIGRVCRHWRSLSRSSPSLLSTIQIVRLHFSSNIIHRAGPRITGSRNLLS